MAVAPGEDGAGGANLLLANDGQGHFAPRGQARAFGTDAPSAAPTPAPTPGGGRGWRDLLVHDCANGLHLLPGTPLEAHLNGGALEELPVEPSPNAPEHYCI